MTPAVFRKSAIVLFLMMDSFLRAQSQEPPVALLKTVVPPSPNAASLGKYGAWPVNLYTGVPSIEIPIHTVQGRSIQVPVGLSYHASGIKVSDIASWVGLGWSLQAGGMITRSVRGLPDEEPTQGYFTMRQRYPNPGDLSTSTDPNVWQDDMEQASKGARDTEHDVYMINALGKSYKLVFLGDGTISTIPYSNVKVIPDFLHDLWHVYLEDGTKLVFGGAGSNSNDRYTESSTTSFGEVMGLISFTSTWHLHRIITATGEVINFSYGLYGITQQAFYTESDNIQYPDVISAECLWTETPATPYAPQLVIGALLLSAIDTDLERVELIPQSTGRSDLQGGRALDEIKIFSKTENAYIDDYKFNYSYSEAVSGNELLSSSDYDHHRLKLNSLVRNRPGSTNPQVWTFEYNSTTLPSRTSFAQDHWGYFNGRTNESHSLLPRYTLVSSLFPQLGFVPPVHDLGADRDGDKDFVTAEILTRINYPTKGYSAFEYDANLGPVVSEEKITSMATDPASIFYFQGSADPFIPSKTITFDVNYAPQVIAFSFSSLIAGEFDQTGVQTSGVVIDPDNTPVDGAMFTNLLGQTADEYGYFTITKTGTYKLVVSTTADQYAFQQGAYVSADAKVYYLKNEGMVTRQKLAGGMHVTHISDYSGDPAQNVDRYFTYERPLIIDPFTPASYIDEHYTNGIHCSFRRITRNSVSRFSLGLVQGGHVGFEKVTTKYGANAENGYTISLFTSEADEGTSEAQIFPYPPTIAVDWRRGLLQAEVHYKTDGTPVSRLINTYTFEPKGSITCYKVGFYKTTMPTEVGGGLGGTIVCPGQVYQICDLAKVYYSVKTERVKLTSSSQRNLVFRNNQLDSVVVETNYFYDTPVNAAATRTEVTNSKTEVVKVSKKTPFEKSDLTGLSADASLAIDSMLRKNMVSAALEQQTYKNNTLVSRSRTNFKYQNSRVLPDNIFLQNGTGPFEKRVQFNRYDGYGNLLEQFKVNDMNTAYIWGFQGNLLLAEVKNATYQQVIDALGQGTLNALNSSPGTDTQIRQTIQTLRAASTMQKAQITTYTYRPGIGISSVTDLNGKTTYYEYDSFNRLSIIKDLNAQILKTFDYHYKQ